MRGGLVIVLALLGSSARVRAETLLLTRRATPRSSSLRLSYSTSSRDRSPPPAVEIVDGDYETLALDPTVAWVERDQKVFLQANFDKPTGVSGSWGVDRVDRVPRNGYDDLNVDTSKVVMYLLDSGIDAKHEEFKDASIEPGHDAFERESSNTADSDCHGHGTHVASTAVGKSVGIARRSTLVPIRVVGCDGTGYVSDVVRGFESVLVDWSLKSTSYASAIAIVSLSSAASRALDAAVEAADEAGIKVVVAAGNHAKNACDFSPARSKHAWTVGGLSPDDTKAFDSNFGGCVNSWAPGEAILGASANSKNSYVIKRGTSMAVPHVAGVLAMHAALGLKPRTTSLKPVVDLDCGEGDETAERAILLAPSATLDASYRSRRIVVASPSFEAQIWHPTSNSCGSFNLQMKHDSSEDSLRNAAFKMAFSESSDVFLSSAPSDSCVLRPASYVWTRLASSSKAYVTTHSKGTVELNASNDADARVVDSFNTKYRVYWSQNARGRLSVFRTPDLILMETTSPLARVNYLSFAAAKGYSAEVSDMTSECWDSEWSSPPLTERPTPRPTVETQRPTFAPTAPRAQSLPPAAIRFQRTKKRVFSTWVERSSTCVAFTVFLAKEQISFGFSDSSAFKLVRESSSGDELLAITLNVAKKRKNKRIVFDSVVRLNDRIIKLKRSKRSLFPQHGAVRLRVEQSDGQLLISRYHLQDSSWVKVLAHEGQGDTTYAYMGFAPSSRSDMNFANFSECD